MSNLLQQGITTFKSGQKEEARKLFISFVKNNPHSEPGWKWMYNASRTNKERIYCLEQMLRINPGNTRARQLLDGFMAPSVEQDSRFTGKAKRGSARVQKSNINIVLFGAVATVVLVASLGLTFASARLASNKDAGNAAVSVSSPTPVRLTNPAIPATATPPKITFLPTLTHPPSVQVIPTAIVAPIHLVTSGPDLRLAAPLWR